MSKKILIIDDEKDFCKLVKKNLEQAGDFRVAIATSGKKGLKLVRKLEPRPHLILLDINMPDIDGFKILERLKKHEETMDIPVVMLSARTDDESKRIAAELFDDLYITKPVEINDLKAKIEEVFKLRGIEQ